MCETENKDNQIENAVESFGQYSVNPDRPLDVAITVDREEDSHDYFVVNPFSDGSEETA